MTKISAQQPYFMPDFYYFYKIYRSDIFLIADHLLFRKQSPLIRARLHTTSAGRYLSVAVKHRRHPHPKISAVELADSNQWKPKHLKTLESGFRSTPYFEHFFPELKTIYDKEHSHLLPFLKEILLWQTNILFPGKTLLFAGESGISGDAGLANWFGSYHNAQWLIYREESDYYRQRFPNESQQIVELPHHVKFPEGYTPDLPVLFLLFLRGPETVRYFTD